MAAQNQPQHLARPSSGQELAQTKKFTILWMAMWNMLVTGYYQLNVP